MVDLKAVDNVVPMDTNWFGHVHPKDVLEGAAKDESIVQVLVIAHTKDGGLLAASSVAEIGEMFLMIEQFKHHVLTNGFETE